MATGTLVKTSTSKSAEGNATDNDVLEGKTFSNSFGVGLLGKMPNNGLIQKTLDASSTQIDLNGKYDSGSFVKIDPYTMYLGVSNTEHVYEAPAGKVITRIETTACPGTAEPEHVLTGKTFSGYNGINMSGAMVNNGAISKVLDTVNVLYNIPEGYHNGKGTITLECQDKVATLKGTNQTISADSGKVLRSVSIPAVTGTADIGHVLLGKTFTSSKGASLTGTMSNFSSMTLNGGTCSLDDELNMLVGFTTSGYYDPTSKLKVSAPQIATEVTYSGNYNSGNTYTCEHSGKLSYGMFADVYYRSSSTGTGDFGLQLKINGTVVKSATKHIDAGGYGDMRINGTYDVKKGDVVTFVFTGNQSSTGIYWVINKTYSLEYLKIS